MISGAHILSTFNLDLPNDAYGYLTSVDVIEMFANKYLHLKSSNQSICTLVLCSRTPAALEELKVRSPQLSQEVGMGNMSLFWPWYNDIAGADIVNQACTAELLFNQSHHLLDDCKC